MQLIFLLVSAGTTISCFWADFVPFLLVDIMLSEIWLVVASKHQSFLLLQSINDFCSMGSTVVVLL